MKRSEIFGERKRRWKRRKTFGKGKHFLEGAENEKGSLVTILIIYSISKAMVGLNVVLPRMTNYGSKGSFLYLVPEMIWWQFRENQRLGSVITEFTSPSFG